MDTSPEYIKMMSRNYDLRLFKFYTGFTESDYIYDGKNVFILGHDHLLVKQYFDHNHFCVRIALYKPVEALSYNSDGMSCIEAKDGSYNVNSIYNPVWLPRQDQLQEMVFELVQSKPGKCRTRLMKLFAEFLEFVGDSGANYDSFEQLWLAFVMKEKYNKVWNGNDWEE